jgi:alpha-ketoglutarate-dependent sulfate ester dioxygenase
MHNPTASLENTLSTALLDAPRTRVRVQPLSAHIGALIHDVDLRDRLDPSTVRDIRAALLQWKVVFFRDQHLSHEQHLALARQFGEPTIGHPVFGHVDGYPEIYAVSKHRDANRHGGEPEHRPWTGWHTDVTAAHNPRPLPSCGAS